MSTWKRRAATVASTSTPARPGPANATGDSVSGTSRSGTVLSIQRMSTEDGPGLRTTVFLKGCSLACAWCHNPESICLKPQLVWHRRRCLSAGLCVEACPEEALTLEGGSVVLDRELCTTCGDCVEACPSGAFEMLGKTWSADELAAELARDAAYFERGGGGVTISGGEPGLQASFVLELLDRCRALGLATALDTAGLASLPALLEMAMRSDVLLYDLKHIDSARHHCLTGQPNERILTAAVALADLHHAVGHPREIWVRTPLIPGATMEDENILGIGAFLAERMGGAVSRWELCAFNNLAVDKYERLGLRWPFAGAPLLTRAELAHAEELAKTSGVDPSIVVATGPTRTEERK